SVRSCRRLVREREEQPTLHRRRVLPEPLEMVVLRTEHLLARRLDVRRVRDESLRQSLPDLVRELLCRVRMPPGRLEETGQRVVVDPLVGGGEALADEGRELRRRDRPQLERLGAAPERLVLVVEDPVEYVPLAAEIDVPYVRLGLEYRTEELRVMRVELDDLLELVEDHDHAALPLLGEPPEQLEKRLDGLVDVGLSPRAPEAERERRVVRIELHRRPDPQVSEESRRAFERLPRRRVDVAVNGFRQRGREALLRRDPQQIAVADEDPVRDRLLGGRQDERRLAVAPWRVDENVLAVAHGGAELRELVLAVGEGLVEREGSELERVVMFHCVT